MLLAICGICGVGAGLAPYPLVFQFGARDAIGTVPQISVQVLPPPARLPALIRGSIPQRRIRRRPKQIMVSTERDGDTARKHARITPARKDNTDQTELPDFAQGLQPTTPELADPDRQAMAAAIKRLSSATPADTTAINRERLRRE